MPKTRVRKTRKTRPRFSLSYNPETPAEAIAAANAISGGYKKPYINEYTIPAKKIAIGDWSAVQFLSRRLSAFFDELFSGGFFAVKPLEKFGNMLNGRTVRGAFVPEQHAAAHGMIALWDNKTNYITSMAASHDTFIDYKQGRRKTAEEAWEQRAKLMLPARLGLPQTRAVSVILSRRAVASAWYPFTLSGKLTEKQKSNREKLVCLYLNSSAGVLALMGVRDFRILGFPRFSTDSMGKLPLPNLDKLSPQKIAAMAAAFDKYAKMELLPLRNMAECETRKLVDNAVADALGIDMEIMEELRGLLPKEPSISGKRYEPLTLKQRRAPR